MRKKILNFLLILVLGGLGGVLAVQVLLPWLAGFSFFGNISWIKNSREGMTVINRTEQINISEDQAFVNAVAKASNSVVLVLAERTEKTVGGKKVALAQPEVTAQASGLIVSSDGLIITSDNIAGAEEQKIIVKFEDRESEAQVARRDKNSGLALLRVNENNLAVLPFAEEGTKLGETLLLLGAEVNQGQLVKFVDRGIAREVSPTLLADFPADDITGSPIFNIKGETVGIRLAVSASQAQIVEAATIENLLK